MIIVAVMDNPTYAQMGFHFFDESDWPQAGYTMIKQVITDMTAAEFAAWDRELARKQRHV